MWAAATGKARLPTVASLTGGTTRRLVPAERRALRPGTRNVFVRRICGYFQTNCCFLISGFYNEEKLKLLLST